MLKSTKPPYVDTKLSIPEGVPCSTFSNFLERWLIFERESYYGSKVKYSKQEAKTVLKAAEEPKHIPMGT